MPPKYMLTKEENEDVADHSKGIVFTESLPPRITGKNRAFKPSTPLTSVTEVKTMTCEP